jgi:hypothetical protein
MNWGAFGGALASSALNTYERLGEEELRDMQRKQLKKDIAEKEALDAAWRQSQARVGQSDDYTQALKTGSNIGTEQAQMLSNQGALSGNTAEDQAFERASAEAATGAMRQNAQYMASGKDKETRRYDINAPAEGERRPQAALPAMSPTEYTKAKGMEDYVKAAGQISRKGTLEAIQLKQVVRQSENEDKFFAKQEKLNDDLASIRGAADSFGLKGVYDVASKNGLKNLKFVEGKNGVGSRIQVLGPKGDVLETISDLNSAVDKLSEVAMGRFMKESVSLLGSPDKVIAFMQGERQIGLKEREVNVKEKEAVDKGEYYKGYADYLRSGGRGAKDSAKARAEEYAELLVESGEPNPKTGKPYTLPEARKQAIGLVLKAPDTKGPTVNPDGSVTMGGQLFVPHPNIPGKYIPATGLPGGATNPVVDAFKNFNGNPPGAARPQAKLPPKAIPDETDRNIASAIMP